MKVLYSLIWLPTSEGIQPYEQVAAAGASLDGGIHAINGRYLGEISGSSQQIQAAIDGCASFSMVSITEEQAEEFLSGSLPPSIQERLQATEILINILGDF